MFISSNIKYILKNINQNQDEFGANIDLKRGVIGNYVRKKTQPSLETIIKMAQYCNVSIDELLLSDFQKKRPFIIVDGDEYIPTENEAKDDIYNKRFNDIESTLTLIKKTLAQTVIDVENLSLKSKKTKS